MAIARAVYVGVKVLILDEPTSALGVKQAAVVLRYIAQTRDQGIGVIDREETGRDGDHLAEAFHEESDSIHEDEDRGRETT